MTDDGDSGDTENSIILILTSQSQGFNMTGAIDWLILDFATLPLHVAFQSIGVIGSLIYICSFFLIQSGRICTNRVLYPCMQLFAANCVLISLTTAFNLAAVIVQVSFILIALYGIWYRITGRLNTRLERLTKPCPEPLVQEIAHHKGLAGTDAQSLAPANLQTSPVVLRAALGGQGHSGRLDGPDTGWSIGR